MDSAEALARIAADPRVRLAVLEPLVHDCVRRGYAVSPPINAALGDLADEVGRREELADLLSPRPRPLSPREDACMTRTYTRAEAASRLKVTVGRVSHLTSAGQLRQVRDGRRVLIDADDVDAMAKERETA